MKILKDIEKILIKNKRENHVDFPFINGAGNDDNIRALTKRGEVAFRILNLANPLSQVMKLIEQNTELIEENKILRTRIKRLVNSIEELK